MTGSRNLISLGGPEGQKGNHSTLTSGTQEWKDQKANERTRILAKTNHKERGFPREKGGEHRA